jgi:hypothetical protein
MLPLGASFPFDFGFIPGTKGEDGDPIDVLVARTRMISQTNGQKVAIGKYQEGVLIGDWRWWGEVGKLTESKTYDGTQQANSNLLDAIKTGRAPSSEQAR